MRDDLYATLGVEPGATLEQIEAAYRRLARQYHPDVNPSPEAATRMREINQAYRELRDPLRRAEYDRRRVQTARAASAEQSAAWEKFAAWDAPRQAAPPPAPPAAPTWHMPSVSLSVIVGAALVVLLAGLVLVFNTTRPSATAQGGGPTVVLTTVATTPTPGPTNSTGGPPNPGSSSAALVVAELTRTPMPPATATRTAVPPTGTATRQPATATPTATPSPTDSPATGTPTAPPATGTPTVAPTRAATPPLNVLASDFYNEQETVAGGRKFQIKLTILNQGTQTLTPPWRPRFLVMAGDRQKGWVDASYYGPDKGGVDISRQPPIAPGQQQAWSWYHVTAGPDEWIRQIEFVGLGWRWTWTFDRVFQTPQLSVMRP